MARTLAERLKARARQLGLSERAIGEHAGRTRSYVHDIWRGRSPRPNRARLQQFADVLQVDAEWLLSGMGRVEGEPPALLDDPDSFILVPSIKAPVVAGRGKVEETALAAGEPYQLRRSWILHHLQVDPEALRVMHVEGDSMLPTLLDGDMVLVNTARRQPRPPGIFVLFDGLGLVVKRLELLAESEPPRVRVVSDNPAYQSCESSLEEIRIFGRVRWFGRLL